MIYFNLQAKPIEFKIVFRAHNRSSLLHNKSITKPVRETGII